MTTVLSCIICSENYKNTDDIYSTTCGHIFHFRCMQQWQSRSLSCPQCRHYNPQNHKVYLNFEEVSSESDQNITQLKSQMDQAQKNVNDLKLQLDQSETHFLELQGQFNLKEDEVKELNIKNQELIEQLESQTDESEIYVSKLQSKLTESERDFLHLQLQFHKNEEKLRNFESITTTTVLDGRKGKKNMPKSDNLGELIMLREQIKVLREKLGQTATQLAKEIQKSAEMTFEKMKLESLVGQYSAKLIATQPIHCSNVTPKGKNIGEIGQKQNQQNEISVVASDKDANVAKQFHHLFHYAKDLKNYGYKFIYCKNGGVYVRKNKTSIPQRVFNKQHVDVLKELPIDD